MKSNESAIAKQAVAELEETPLRDEIGQQLVAQLVNIFCADTINLFLGLTLAPLKTIILVNTPAKPMKFDLSNFMLKLCGFSLFSALLIPSFTKNNPPTLSNNQWRFM